MVAITGTLPAGNVGYNAPIQGYFPGQTVAGLSPWTQQSWGAGANAASQIAGVGNQALNRWQTGFDMGMLGNPWLDQQVNNMQDSMYRSFNRNTMPAIRRNAAISGQGGGSRQGIAEGIATSDLNRQVSDATTGMYGQAYRDQLGHTANMTSQMPSLMGAYSESALTPFNMMQGIGNQIRGYNQELLDEEMNRWNYHRDSPWQRLANYAGIQGQIPISQSSTSSGSGGGFNFGIGKM